MPKISELSAETPPAAGDELVPVVSAGATKHLTVDQVAARATSVGAVSSGPASFDNDIPLFSGTSGKVLKDVGLTFDDDTALAAASSTRLPTQHAVKAYVDASVIGLFDDRGNYDASGNVFPATGGSGPAGAVKKGDVWLISVAGTLGGTAVVAGDQILARVDTPGQTAGNWLPIEHAIGYTPADDNAVVHRSGGNETVLGIKKFLFRPLTSEYPAFLNLPVDGTTDASTALASLDLVPNDINTVVINRGDVLYVNTDLTLTNIELDIRPGGLIKVGTGHTFKAPIKNPGLRTILNTSGTPGVFVPTNQAVWDPIWWGATGTSDDTATWQYMDAACTATQTTLITGVLSAQIVRVPKGVNKVFNLDLSGNSYRLIGGQGVSSLQPAGTPTSGHMVRMGSYSHLDGAFLNANGRPGITLIDVPSGNRFHANDIFAVTGGSTGGQTVFNLGNSSGSMTATLHNVFILGAGSSNQGTVNSGTGITVAASDIKLSAVVIGQCNVGIDVTFGGPIMDMVHLWGSYTAGIQGAPDGMIATNVYLDSNGGTGAAFTNLDRAVLTGWFVWRNGTNATGNGMSITKVGGFSCSNNVLTGFVFDDNTGSGLVIDGASGTDISATRFGSRSVQGGGAAVSTYGLDITSTATNTTARIRGANADHTTAVVRDLSGSSSINLGELWIPMPSDVVVNNTTTYTNLGVSFTGQVKDVFEIKAVHTAKMAVTGVGCKVRLLGATGVTGYIMGVGLLANSAASGTADSSNPQNNYQAVASAGATGVPTGLPIANTPYMFQQEGKIDCSGASGATTFTLQGAQVTASANDTTFIADGTWLRVIRRR